MSILEEKLMKAEEVSSELKKILDEQKNKHPTSYFDVGKARQTIYSILMGFVLKYFFEHLYNNREIILSLDKPHLIAYSCILIYFFLNCFRFLFGLVDYSNMTDENFAPQDADWTWGNFMKNTLKLFVINTGVFQMIIFSFSVFLLFPHLDTDTEMGIELKTKELVSSMPQIIICFCISTFLLLTIDIISLFLFKKFVEKKDFVKREKAQHAIWYFTDCIEAIVSGSLLCLIYKSQPDCATNFQKSLLVILALLAILETLGIYRYLEKPFMIIRDFLYDMWQFVKNFKFQE